MNRHEQIVALLRWYPDATCTLQRGDRGGKFVPESRLLSMPAIYHRGSYRALERCLSELAHADWRAFLAVRERYLRSERRTRLGRRRDVAGNEFLLQAGHWPVRDSDGRRYVRPWIYVERWRPGLDLREVERGIVYLERAMPRTIRVPRVPGGWVGGREQDAELLAA